MGIKRARLNRRSSRCGPEVNTFEPEPILGCEHVDVLSGLGGSPVRVVRSNDLDGNEWRPVP